jgi:multiple antibiotic resistance protein
VNAQLFGEVLVTLVVIMDPPGNVPIFLSVTRRLSDAERHRAAAIAVLTAFAVITTFALAGRQVLEYLHVSVPALQGAGGLLLLLVALELLTGRGGERGAEATPEQRTSIAMVPLGTPLLAGPGVIVATIVFTGQADGRGDWLAIGAGIVAVSMISYLALRFSGLLNRLIRPTGVLLLSRVAGILLAAIAVQMIANSVIAFVEQARVR